MSVTIVASLPQPTQSAVADTPPEGDSIIAGPDFASLLLGQLLPITSETPAASVKKDDSPVTEATPTDAAALLAAASIAPQILATADAASDSRLIPKDRSISSGLATPPAPPTLGDSLKSDAKTEALKTEPSSSTPSPVEDKPAKVAAIAPSSTRSTIEITQEVSPDTSPRTVQPLSGNALASVNTLPNHETVPLSIATPIRDQSWASEFGQKIVWLAANDKQTALITLNPPKMGPIEVSLNLDKGNAIVSFASASGETRDAIDSALPRLRDMFASAGIALGQANVSAESFGRQAGNGDEGRPSSPWTTDRSILAVDSVGSLPGSMFSTKQGNGLIDIFA